MAHEPHMFTASYLVLLKGDHILLQRRFQTGFMDGMYSLPAGHIEVKESATHALIREIQEEIGITLTAASVNMAHVMQRDAKNGREYLDIYFTASKWKGTPTICEPEKSDDLSWFPVNKLPTNTIPYIQAAIQNIQNGLPFSEYSYS